MAEPRNARKDGGKRLYSWRDEGFWSVTSIIKGGLPAPVLVPWGIRETGLGAITGRKVLAEMLASCQTPDTCTKARLQEDLCPDCFETLRWLKDRPYAQRDRAAELGTYVHDAAEAYALGKPYPRWPLPVQPRMDAFVRFLADYQPVYEMTEASVFNRTEKYAGTLDAIATIGGRRLLLDTKTGKGVYPEVALQLAAYRHAEFIGLPDGSEAPMPQVDGAAALHLPEVGGYELIEVRADAEVFTAFLYVRETFRFAEETSKTVILGPYNEVALAVSAATFGEQPAGVA